MSTHTPGPWISCTGGANDHDWYVLAEDENDVLVTGASEPDARLIAAAPDLLAALKRMEIADRKQAAGEIYDYSNAVLEARAAIAKAEGAS